MHDRVRAEGQSSPSRGAESPVAVVAAAEGWPAEGGRLTAAQSVVVAESEAVVRWSLAATPRGAAAAEEGWVAPLCVRA